MATPTETSRRAQGFGARRFLVRGSDFTSEASLGAIRPRITDYPERVSLTPDFPGPGRRGGSRAAPQILAEGELAGVPQSPWPVARERDATKLTGIAAGLTPAQQALVNSPRGPGFPRTHRVQVAAGVTTVLATVALPGPALMTRLEISSDITAVSPFIDVGFRWSYDDDTTGGFATTGNRFFLAGVGIFDVNLPLQTLVWTPNVLIPANRWFLKIIVRNNQAGTVTVITAFSVEWL